MWEKRYWRGGEKLYVWQYFKFKYGTYNPRSILSSQNQVFNCVHSPAIATIKKIHVYVLIRKLNSQTEISVWQSISYISEI